MLLNAVDILDLIGLRSGNLPDSVASLVTGPSGQLDAFQFQEELNTSTDRLEWELIGQDFPSQFGLYTVFNASEYEGSIFSVSVGTEVIFDVSLWKLENSSSDALFIILPGLSALTVEIPESVNFRDASSFRRLAIRLAHYQLLVIIDCSVVNFVSLEQPPLPLQVENSRVDAFSGGAIVSVRYTYLYAVFTRLW